MSKKLPKIPMVALKDFYELRGHIEMLMAIYAQDVNNPNRFDRMKEREDKAREICTKWIEAYPPKDF